MAISLSKGGNISLAKSNPNLKKIQVGLGWNSDVDLDASAFLLNHKDKVRGENDFVFYNQLTSSCGSIEHTGDEKEGTGTGDEEIILVDLESIPNVIKKIMFTVTIHDAEGRNQNFGNVDDAYIRLVNEADKSEIARFDLSEDFSTETALEFGCLSNDNGEWKFEAIGKAFTGGLLTMCNKYGIKVA